MVPGTSGGAIPSVPNSSEVCGKVSSLVRWRPLTDRPKRHRRLVVTALGVAEGRKKPYKSSSLRTVRAWNEVARNPLRTTLKVIPLMVGSSQ